MANVLSTYRGKPASSLANPTSATVFKAAANSAQASFVAIPLDSGATNGKFRIRARGRATTGTTSNFLAKFQFTTDVTATASSTIPATAANNTDFFTLTNRSLASITRYWEIEATVVWDSTSQRMSGQSNGFNLETIETANASITALTGVDLTTRKCGFVVAALFGSTNAGNIAYLDDLVLEVL